MRAEDKEIIFEDIFKKIFRIGFIMGVEGRDEFYKLVDEKVCMNRLECECEVLEEIVDKIILNHENILNFKIIKKT